MTKVTVSPSVLEIHVCDKSTSKFEPVQTSNLWVSLATTQDHAPIFAHGKDNSNQFDLAQYAVSMPTPSKPGLYAFVLTINIEGLPCAGSERNPMAVQPKWEFFVNFDEILCTNDVYRSAVWSNDGSEEIMYIEWNCNVSCTESMSFVEELKGLQVSAKSLQDTIQQSTTQRRHLLMDTIKHLTGQIDTADCEKNYYTVPCCVLGPVGQVRVRDRAFLTKSFTELQSTMLTSSFLVDYEQANEINKQSCLMRKQYWIQILIHLSIKVLVEIWQEDESCTIRQAYNAFCKRIDKTSQVSSGTILHNILFRFANQYFSSHLAYIPDTNIVIVKENGTEASLAGDGSGESQLMTGINSRCSTWVRRFYQPSRQSLLPNFLRGDTDVDGDTKVGDCEDNAHAVAALNNFLLFCSLEELDQFWPNLPHSIQSLKQDILELWKNVKTTSRRKVGACLGVANAASITETLTTQFQQPEFLKELDAFKFMNTNLANNKLQGHCWCALATITPYPQENHDIDDNAAIEVGFLADIQHGETTSLTYDVTNLDDPLQKLDFKSNNETFCKQFDKYKDRNVPFSTAASIRNNIWAEFFNQKHKNDVVCNGIQFANQNDTSGFLQFIFCLGGWNFFIHDTNNSFMSIPTPQYHRFKPVAVRIQCSEREKNAIKTLIQSDISKYPHFSSCVILPPEITKRHGKSGAIAVLCKESAVEFADVGSYDIILKTRKQRQVSWNACGFQMIDLTRTVYFFE